MPGTAPPEQSNVTPSLRSTWLTVMPHFAGPYPPRLMRLAAPALAGKLNVAAVAQVTSNTHLLVLDMEASYRGLVARAAPHEEQFPCQIQLPQ